MRLNLPPIAALAAILFCSPLFAADTEWTGGTDNNFFNDSNWTSGAPSSTDDLAIIDGGSNLPATISADTGTVEIGAVSLGRLDAGGHVVQNGGTLVIFGDDIGEESQIGDTAEENSSWIMNGNSVILYDDPLGADGDGLDSDGTGKDFDVGKNLPEGFAGRLELHDNAILRISDDLKIADGDAGHGEVFLDGNSQITVGSGISASGTTSITVAGNALLLTGNSAAPGDMNLGRTDEGYLTLSTGGEDVANVEIRDSGRLLARTLQQRDGESNVIVRDNGQFHIFDAYENAEPNLGNATVVGSVSGPQRTSHVSSAATAETTITLLDNAIMTIDSDLEDSGWSGFAMSGGTNSGANSNGGTTTLEIADNATFAIEQDLNMTLGTGDDTTSTLRVRGPNATVTINGDLRMALDDFDDENFGTAILHAELTDRTHSTVTVGGTAVIGNGNLVVTFSDYTPSGGESYQLLTAGEVDGAAFRETTLPELSEGLTWDLSIDSTSVLLSILGGGLLGDFNQNGMLDIDDINLLTVQSASGANDPAFDLNGDAVVNGDDAKIWAKDLANTWVGDSNLDGEFNSGDFVVVFQGQKFEQDIEANWSEGDWNGDGRFNSGDFVAAFQDSGYEKGPRPAAVPEPTYLTNLCGFILLILIRKR